MNHNTIAYEDQVTQGQQRSVIIRQLLSQDAPLTQVLAARGLPINVTKNCSVSAIPIPAALQRMHSAIAEAAAGQMCPMIEQAA